MHTDIAQRPAAKGSAQRGPNRLPDVVLFFPDQWNPRFIGYEPGAQVLTPNIDQMAAEGAVFSSCYSPCPVCMPARCCLASGRYPHNLGLWGNGPYYLPPEESRIFKDLSSAGYRTAQIGKVHRFSGDGWKERFAGFDELIAASGIDYLDKLPTPFTIQEADGRYRSTLEEFGLFDAACEDRKNRLLTNQYLVRPSVLPPELHPDSLVADRTLEFIERHPANQPMFLFVNFPGPHTPLDASGRYERMYPPEDLTVLPNVRPFERDNAHYGRAEVQRMMASYFGKITMIDHNVGRIIEGLRKRGTWDNTLAIFASDHGESLGSHGRVSKGIFFEESGRVPLVVRWPGRVPPGRRCEALVSLLDVYPTAVEAAAGKLSDKHFAHSFLSIATGEACSVRDAVFSEIAQKDNLNYMIRDERYKWFIWNREEYLFDMENDPFELENLITDPAARAVSARLKDRHWHFLRNTQVNEVRGYPPLVERIRTGASGQREAHR